MRTLATLWLLASLIHGFGQDLHHDILSPVHLYQKGIFQYELDNDAFAGFTVGEDRNYTMGTGLSVGVPSWNSWSIFGPNFLLLKGIWRLGNPETAWSPERLHQLTPTLSFGSIGFTPEDLAEPQPVWNDRPYASPLWLGTSSRFLDTQTGYTHSLSLHYGILGIGVAAWVQTLFHTIHPIRPIPEGWHNQISQGGEPTFLIRYQRDRFDTLIQTANWYVHGRETIRLEAGYRVQGAFAWTLTGGYEWPNSAKLYALARLKPQLTLYDVMLMGQFRPSAHTLEWKDIHPMVLEFALGIGGEIPMGNRRIGLWYGYYGRTPEAYYGINTRFHYWGRFQLYGTF